MRLSLFGYALEHPRNDFLRHRQLVRRRQFIPLGHGFSVVRIRSGLHREHRFGFRLPDVVVKGDAAAVVGLRNPVIERRVLPRQFRQAAGRVEDLLPGLIRRDLAGVELLPNVVNHRAQDSFAVRLKEDSHGLPRNRLHLSGAEAHAFGRPAVGLKVKRVRPVLPGRLIANGTEVVLHWLTVGALDRQGIGTHGMRINRRGLGVMRVIEVVVEVPHLELRADLVVNVVHAAVHDNRQGVSDGLRVKEERLRRLPLSAGYARQTAYPAFRRQHVVG